MAISLKLVPEEEDNRIVQTLKFIKDNDNDNEVNLSTANKEGFSIDEPTLDRLKDLVILGQRYEEVSQSQKSEFSDL